MSIRAVHNADFEAIADITNHYITTSAIHFGYEPVTADELRAAWASHPRHPYLVDGRDGRQSVWRCDESRTQRHEHERKPARKPEREHVGEYGRELQSDAA